MRKNDCIVATIICLILALILNFQYTNKMQEAKRTYSVTKEYLPAQTSVKKVKEDVRYEYEEYNDEYRRVKKTYYDVTYEYIVDGMKYEKKYYDLSHVNYNKVIYYAPNNPTSTADYATYDDMVDGLLFFKILSALFTVLTFVLISISVYVSFNEKKMNQPHIVMHEDLDTFMPDRTRVQTVKESDKESVEEVETIAFVPKKQHTMQLYTEDELNQLSENNIG